MGLGYWLTEKLIYDEDTGQLLTHNTWVSPTDHSSLWVGFVHNWHYR